MPRITRSISETLNSIKIFDEEEREKMVEAAYILLSLSKS
jgi:hypothetical protein